MRFSGFPGLDETQSRVRVLKEEAFDLFADDEIEPATIEFEDVLDQTRVVFYEISFGMLLKPCESNYV